MRIELCLDQRSIRGWHLDLVERLGRDPGIEVGIRWATPSARPLPSCVEVLFALERVLHGTPLGCAAPREPGDLVRHVGRGGVEPDLTIDLSGGSPAAGRRRWRLTFDGQSGEEAAIAALLAGRMPVVALAEVETGRVVASGRPGAETPHIVVSAFQEVLARTTTLLLGAIRSHGVRLDGASEPALATSCGGVALFAGKALARAALHRIYRLLYRTPHWRTGWRFTDGPDLLELGRHPETGWRDLPDDGLRFYADPFPLVVEGRTWLFVEELEHRTGKGVISAVLFDDDGPVGRPRPVLEGPVHLSYPFVIEEGGSVFMIPESVAAGRVDLYRATRFPGGWSHEATLLEGVEASDATPFRHDGRWWMTATVRDGVAYSDALHLWSAPALQGPWRPHAANPVLIDCASARPAGRVVRRGGRLIRPVQDCRGGYGTAVALAEITRLDDDAFEQRVVARLVPGPLWPGRRLHTLNRAGRLECIDGSALSPRFGRFRGFVPNDAPAARSGPSGAAVSNPL